ncbi:hypothetical protein, partial [Pseudomonas carnis]|uniref:hypothetical protein n=1 Tax=Pseudomonas carnis TaxID=2487355 RepID=UPI001F3D0E60
MKSTLTMLLIAKRRIATERTAWPRQLRAPGRCGKSPRIMQLFDYQVFMPLARALRRFLSPGDKEYGMIRTY